MSSSSSNNALRLIVKIATCARCLQYPEDCACCTSCIGSGEGIHEAGCEEVVTKRSMVIPRNPMTSAPATLRGIGQDLTFSNPRFVIRVGNDVDEFDSTGANKVLR